MFRKAKMKAKEEFEEHKATIEAHCEAYPIGAEVMYLGQKATITENIGIVPDIR